MKTGYVYITSNKNRTTFYVGVTNNIRRRMFEHRTGQSDFTSRYNVYELLYFEEIWGMGKAIAREKQLKNWHREWKLNLIREKNPEMVDLSEGWFTEEQIRKGRQGAGLAELGSATVEITSQVDSKRVETTSEVNSEDTQTKLKKAATDAESSSAYRTKKTKC